MFHSEKKLLSKRKALSKLELINNLFDQKMNELKFSWHVNIKNARVKKIMTEKNLIIFAIFKFNFNFHFNK